MSITLKPLTSYSKIISINDSRLERLLTGDKNTALYMGFWDKICDLFREEKKSEALRTLYVTLYPESSPNDGTGKTRLPTALDSSEGEHFTRCVNAFEKLKTLAEDTHKDRFVIHAAPMPGAVFRACLCIDDYLLNTLNVQLPQVNEGRGINLHGANLSGFNMSEADLRWADMSGTNLNRTNLDGADLRWADMSMSLLLQAILTNAKLQWACLYQADLSWVNLTGSNLTKADMYEAILISAILFESILQEADLRNANLSLANMMKAVMIRTKLCNTNLEGTKLQGAYMREAYLQGSNWEKASMEQTDITDVILE